MYVCTYVHAHKSTLAHDLLLKVMSGSYSTLRALQVHYEDTISVKKNYITFYVATVSEILKIANNSIHEHN